MRSIRSMFQRKKKTSKVTRKGGGKRENKPIKNQPNPEGVGKQCFAKKKGTQRHCIISRTRTDCPKKKVTPEQVAAAMKKNKGGKKK